MNEVQMLVDTPCKDDVLKRAFLFSILTGLRHSDIQTLRWKQIQQTSKGTWQAVVIQQKDKKTRLQASHSTGTSTMRHTSRR